jgi:hypothetical protein
MRMLAFQTGAMEYLNVLYVKNTASLDNIPIWSADGTHKDQGFIWLPGSVGFFVDAEPPSYHLECWVEDEIRLDETTQRAIQVPFKVGNEGITLHIDWCKQDKPMWFHVPAGEYALVFEMGKMLVGEPTLSHEVLEAFTEDLNNDPIVQEHNRIQYEQDRSRRLKQYHTGFVDKIADLMETNPSASREEIVQLLIASEFSPEMDDFRIEPIADYDERLQRWLNDNPKKIAKLTGDDAYNRSYSPRIRLWFTQQANAEAKILVQDSALNPPERLDLWGQDVESY